MVYLILILQIRCILMAEHRTEFEQNFSFFRLCTVIIVIIISCDCVPSLHLDSIVNSMYLSKQQKKNSFCPLPSPLLSLPSLLHSRVLISVSIILKWSMRGRGELTRGQRGIIMTVKRERRNMASSGRIKMMDTG